MSRSSIKDISAIDILPKIAAHAGRKASSNPTPHWAAGFGTHIPIKQDDICIFRTTAYPGRSHPHKNAKIPRFSRIIVRECTNKQLF
jgi:hypothetical protein